ncbi:MAG: DUF3370 family protein [Cyanobacteria bacterium M_surface_10_m2_179]|nr:DUF3370 family protein [Cyanobacteria bacterium M_surface_10_m2_179]
MRPVLMALVGGVLLAPVQAHAYVALMAGETARPLNGSFNNVPVLHSNQPEEVLGPGILVDTRPGSAVAVETNQPLANPTYTFNGEFGLHAHHKYFPEDRSQLRGGGGRRGELTLAAILINPGSRPVHIRFKNGAVRNSFEAPYLANNMMGVKPLGPRPWNTGPGDATAVQMLRGQLDRRLEEEITVPPYGRVVLFSTALPALGIANGLLRGRSDGPFQMAVVAAKNPRSDADILAVLDSGRLAPGRVYLSRVRQIEDGTVFSRVAGVALGDTYQASLNHDLSQGALHVPLTSTTRHSFGTKEVQVNQLASRMLDSSLDNVGTYGVRFDVELNLKGAGPHQLVLSHPTPNGRSFVAFRGSIGIQTDEGYREVHVGLRSGQSLPIAAVNLKPGVNNPVKVSLVYPADATPGHLLSVVSDQQLAQLQQREQLLAAARAARPKPAPLLAPPAEVAAAPVDTPAAVVQAAKPMAKLPARPKPAPPTVVSVPGWMQDLPALPTVQGLPPAVITPTRMSQSLMERYQQAVQAQQQLMNSLMGR